MRIRGSKTFAAATLVLICAGCKPAPSPASGRAQGPQVRAMVVTIRTSVEPEHRVVMHSIVVARGRARSLSEHDVWRLFDTGASTITVVDDVDRTTKTEPIDALVSRRRDATVQPRASFVPKAVVVRTDEHRTILGADAERISIVAGGYRRDLWIAKHPAIPDRLFSMMQMSEPATSPLASMMREVDESFGKLLGFPLLDRTELTIGDTRTVIERNVVSVLERDVPEALLEVPSGYRDLSPSPP